MKQQEREPIGMYLRGSDTIPLLKYFDKLQNRYAIHSSFATKTVYEYFNRTTLLLDDWMSDLRLSCIDNTSLDLPTIIIPFTYQFPHSSQSDTFAAAFCKNSPIEIQENMSPLKELLSYWCNCIPSGDEILSLDCPCILITSITPFSDSFEVLLKSLHELRKSGKKAIGLSCNPNVSLLDGIYYFPRNFLSENYDTNYSLAKLNSFIKNIQKKEYPDILLIEAPGVIMKSSLTGNHCFGIETYAISQVISPDYVICCAPTHLYSFEYWDRFNNVAKYKFGFSVNAIQISNLIVNPKINLDTEDRYLRTMQRVIDTDEANSKSDIFFFDVQSGTHFNILMHRLTSVVNNQLIGKVIL